MAEAFGIFAGAVNVAATYSTVIDVFDHVQSGRHFGRDYETNQLRLRLVELRLSRWGAAVDIHNEPQFGDRYATGAETQLVKDTLWQVLRLLEDCYKASKRGAAGQPMTGSAEEPDLVAPVRVGNKMRELARKRQKDTSLAKLARWAIHDKSELETLIDRISELVDHLESLFPAPKARINALANEEIERVRDNEREVRALAAASESVDRVIHEAAAAAVKRFEGHHFKDVEISDAKAVHNGNAYLDDSGHSAKSAAPAGASHLFEGVKIQGNGETFVMNGDRHGGKDPFEALF